LGANSEYCAKMIVNKDRKYLGNIISGQVISTVRHIKNKKMEEK
jgi:hypothetical protein